MHAVHKVPSLTCACLQGPGSLQKDPSFLSIEQALADFATLISHIREEYSCLESPFIGFGGSYGGMLAAWLRAKYPEALQVRLHRASVYFEGCAAVG